MSTLIATYNMKRERGALVDRLPFMRRQYQVFDSLSPGWKRYKAHHFHGEEFGLLYELPGRLFVTSKDVAREFFTPDGSKKRGIGR